MGQSGFAFKRYEAPKIPGYLVRRSLLAKSGAGPNMRKWGQVYR